MMHSMTAFATAEAAVEPYRVAVSMRSYNSRHLDVALHIGYDYLALEEKIKARITQRLARGRVEVRIKVEDTSPEALAVTVNTARAEACFQGLQQLNAHLDLDAPITLDLLLSQGGILEPAVRAKDMDACWRVLAPCIETALDDLVTMRQREGAFITRDITRRLETVEACIDEIEAASDGMLAHYRQRLMDRIDLLTQGQIELDEDKIAQEAAFLAGRSDISEELVRSASHIQQFRKLMADPAPAGRPLNFLIQEFNREFNTMASKTEKAGVAHTVVTLKTELEKMREQIQNVE